MFGHSVKTPQSVSRCADVAEMVSAYVEGELGASQHRVVALHLEFCARCRGEELAYRAALRTLADRPRAQAPADLYSGFAQRLAEQRGLSRRARPLRWATAAARMIVVVSAGAVAYRAAVVPGHTPAPTTIARTAPLRELQFAVPPVNVQPPAPAVRAARTQPALPRVVAQAPPANALPSKADARPTRVRRQRTAVAGSFLDVRDASGRSARVLMMAAAASTESRPGSEPAVAPDPRVTGSGRFRRSVLVVPSLDESVRVGDTVTRLRGAAGYDAAGNVAVIRVSATTMTADHAVTDGE